MKSKNFKTKDELRKRFSGLGDSVGSLCKGLRTFFPMTRPFLEGPLVVTSGKTMTIESREGTVSIERTSPEEAATQTDILRVRKRE